MHVSPHRHGPAAQSLSRLLSAPPPATYQGHLGGVHLRRPRHPQGRCTEGMHTLLHELAVTFLVNKCVSQPTSEARSRRYACTAPPPCCDITVVSPSHSRPSSGRRDRKYACTALPPSRFTLRGAPQRVLTSVYHSQPQEKVYTHCQAILPLGL